MRLWFIGWLTLLAVQALAATDEELTRAVQQLGAGDFKTRQAASQLLWSAGRAALSALDNATHSTDPEVAMRARELLANIRLGILPDTPPELRAMLEQYRAGDTQQRRVIVEALTLKGEPGWRVLPLLASGEPSLENRALIFQTPLEQLGEQLRTFVVNAAPSAELLRQAVHATELWIQFVPEDITVPLLVIPKLDGLGKRAEADRLFQAELGFQQQLAGAKPAGDNTGAEAQNNLAWLCAVAHRELETGLRAAQKAVALAPRSAPYLDTLAEVYFQRGDQAKAISLIKQAMALDPSMDYLKHQLERLEKGDRTVPPPDVEPDEFPQHFPLEQPANPIAPN